MTAMDFRQYDQALGRFNVMDALSEMAYEQTPYRYGFNNPVFWKDPSGLFETEKQAAKFLSDNGLNGSITYNQDFNGYVVTVQGGEFDGTRFYDFSEVMEDMVIETGSKRGGGSNGTPVPCVKCHHDGMVENGQPINFDFLGTDGYKIWGVGSEDRGKKRKGKHKSINVTDMWNIGAGGTSLKSTGLIFELGKAIQTATTSTSAGVSIIEDKNVSEFIEVILLNSGTGVDSVPIKLNSNQYRRLNDPTNDNGFKDSLHKKYKFNTYIKP